MVVGLALVCANLPFLNNRIFAVFSFPRLLMLKLLGQNLVAQTDKLNPQVDDDEDSGTDDISDAPGVTEPFAKSLCKPFWLRLVELVLLYAVVGWFGFYLEAQQGNRFVQGWQFYATTFSLFVVFAFPGFIYQYLRRKHD